MKEALNTSMESVVSNILRKNSLGHILLVSILKKDALTIRVGLQNTFTKYNFESFPDVRDFLNKMSHQE